MKADIALAYQSDPEAPPPGKEDYERSLTVALLRARESTMRRFKKYADQEDLSLPQWRVLRALADGEPLDAGTLCQRCVILPPSLTRILRAMEEQALVTRATDPADRRRSIVTISAAGQQVIEDHAEASRHLFARLQSAYGAERMETLLDLLEALNDTDFSAD